MNNKEVMGEYKNLAEDALEEIQKLGIDFSTFQIDHYCYRVTSLKEYAEMKEKLKQISRAFVENIHHERPIAKFILKEPIWVRNFETSVIELPAPKKDKGYQRGLEHFEMVVGKNFEELKNKYNFLWTGQDDSGPHNKTVFKVLKNGFTVKFHERSLLEVLELEGRQLTPLL